MKQRTHLCRRIVWVATLLFVICNSFALELEVRLVNGTSRREGRVEVRRDKGQWGRVCAEGFDDADASVVCRQLALGTSGQAKEDAPFGAESTPIFLDGVHCDGTEASLSDCYLYGWKVPTCLHEHSAAVVCLEEEEEQGDGLDPVIENKCPKGFFGYRCRFRCRCYGDDQCNEVTGTCLRGCASSYWGPGCQLSDKCYYNGQVRSYMGRLNHTEDGVPCQDWTAQKPQKHRYTPDDFADGSHPDNFCRATSDSHRPWCYRMRGSRWGYCHVVNCACPVGLFGHNCDKMCHCKDPSEKCDRTLGHCPNGCDKGWTGFDCQSRASSSTTLPQSSKTRTLVKLGQSRVTAQTVAETRSVLEQPGETSAADVVKVAQLLLHATQLKSISPQMAKDVVKILELVSDLDHTVLEQSSSVPNTTTSLIMALEHVADRISLQEEGEVEIETNNTLLHVWNLNNASCHPVLGVQMLMDRHTRNRSSVSITTDSHIQDNVLAAIMLSGDTCQRILQEFQGRDIRVSASVRRQTGLFQEGGRPPDPTGAELCSANRTSADQKVEDTRSQGVHFRLSSKVVSMKLSVDGQPVTDLSPFGHVTTVFQPLQGRQDPRESRSELTEWSQCVVWDFSVHDGHGGWSGTGCHLDWVLSGKVVCFCDHLTHFALLNTYERKEKTTKARSLSLTTMVGLCLSICALALTLVFIVVIKQLRRSLAHQTLFNMALAILLTWLTFLAGIQRVHDDVTCLVVAMLLHYFGLASFLWTLAQGVLCYGVLVRHSARPVDRYLLKAALTAWGVPVIPVLIVSAIDVELYFGGSGYCWMSLSPFYYAFLEPLVIVAVINVLLDVVALVRVRGQYAMSTERGQDRSAASAASVPQSFSCLCGLGLSWMFAILTMEDVHVAFQYLFALAVTFHGLLIFLLYTVRDPVARACCLRTVCRREKGLGSPVPEDDEYQSNVPHTRMDRMETSFNPTY